MSGEARAADRRTFVVFNPASGRGRGARRMSAYRELLERHLPGCTFGVTERAGHEYELTERAIGEGYEQIIAVGGDGTWSHVADVVVESGAPVRFGVLPAGTGNDFGRNLGLDYGDPEGAVRSLTSGRSTRVDVGRILTPSAPAEPGKPAGQLPRPRHFLNLVGLGFDIAVIDAAASARFLRGALLYKVTALQQLFRFEGLEVAIRDGEGFDRAGTHLIVTITNGKYFGGGFPMAPDADVRDGRLHACLISDASPFQRLSLFNAAERGEHVRSERTTVHPAPRFQLELGRPTRFEADGDVFVTEGGSLEVEVIPNGLELLGG